jgi:hypothetical protein
MARFIGTINDYEKYIGPRIRNIVNTFAKSERDKRQGICEFCNKKAELQSAHKHGKGRKTLIHEALKEYDKGSYFDVDIEECEKKILESHKPIEQVFHFLCFDCHREYDSNHNEHGKQEAVNIRDNPRDTDNYDETQEIRKIERKIPRWFEEKEQINSKILYAFIRLHEQNNGMVTYEQLEKNAKIPKFKGNFDQMKNFGIKNHGKIFEQVGQNIYLWEKVEDIIWNYYNTNIKRQTKGT